MHITLQIIAASVGCFLLLQFTFGQIDRLLKAACGAQRLRLRGARARLQQHIKRFIASNPYSLTAFFARIRLTFLQLLAKRKMMRRIQSPALTADICDAYQRGLEDRLTRRRLKKYIAARKLGDADACLEVLERITRSASFALLSPARPLLVGLAVCFERSHDRGPPVRLVMGMELWMLLIYQWASKVRMGFIGSAFGRVLDVTLSRIVLEGVAHESIHVLQEMKEGLLTREYESSPRRKVLTFRTWARCEWEALVYGSPMWICGLAVLLIPFVMWGATRP
jgi:hypothetical protein